MIDQLESHMQALQMLSRAQEVTADNMANIDTPGFRGSKLFHRMLTEKVDGVEVTRPEAMQQINLEQGVLEATGNPFDLALDGDGFFTVNDGGENLLTRDGRFHLDTDGYLVNQQGAHVQGEEGAIHIPEYFHAIGEENGEIQLEVARDGTIRLNGEIYDRIRLQVVENPETLERRGNSYYTSDTARQLDESEQNVQVMQGHYEKGNVNPLNEMVDMMRTMQMFEAQQRAMSSTDENLGQAATSLARF